MKTTNVFVKFETTYPTQEEANREVQHYLDIMRLNGVSILNQQAELAESTVLLDKCAAIMTEAMLGEDGIDSEQAQALINAIRVKFADIGKTTIEHQLETFWNKVGEAAGYAADDEFKLSEAVERIRQPIRVAPPLTDERIIEIALADGHPDETLFVCFFKEELLRVIRRAIEESQPKPNGHSIVRDLSVLVARLAYQLKRAAPANEFPAKAAEFLRKHNLMGSPLRDDSAAEYERSPEQTAQAGSDRKLINDLAIYVRNLVELVHRIAPNDQRALTAEKFLQVQNLVPDPFNGKIKWPKTIEPEWIVNDLGELGVKIAGRCFFLYKGYSLEYKDVNHEDTGEPMLYRPVGKREFGETCWPLSWIVAGRRQDRYTVDLVYSPRLSDGKPEDYKWRPLLPPFSNVGEGAC